MNSQSIKASVLTGSGLSADCKGCWAWHTSRGGKKGQTACLKEVSARCHSLGTPEVGVAEGPANYGLRCLYLGLGRGWTAEGRGRVK